MDIKQEAIRSITLKNGIIQGCTPEFLQLLDLNKEDVIQSPLKSLIVTLHPGDENSVDALPLEQHGFSKVVALRGSGQFPVCAQMTLETAHSNDEGDATAVFTPLSAEALTEQRDNVRRLQVGVNVWQVGLFEHNHLSGLIYSSTRLREMYGLAQDKEMNFMQFASAIHPDDQDNENVKKSHDPAGDGHYEEQYRIIKPSGEIRWMHTRARTTFGYINGERRALSTTGSIFDITDSHLLKVALEENKQQLADILNSLPSMVLGVNTEGRVTQWNSQSQIHTGIAESEALHQPIEIVYPMLSTEIASIKKSQKNQVTIDRTRVPWTKNGQMFFYNICITPLRNSNSSDVVIRIDDVTEQVRFEEMLVHSEKLLSVGGLAAGMAHEINNPLAAVLQSMQVIQNRLNPTLPANQKAAEEIGVPLKSVQAYLDERKISRMINAVSDAGNRAAAIVRNMLSFVRISNNDQIRCNLAELMDTSLELALNDYDLTRKIDFRKIEIRRNYNPEVHPVFCDAGKIQQVLLNLIKNAGQALFDAKVPSPRITIRILPQQEYSRIEFEDNGPGIPQEVSRRIFEPFFTTKQVGTGTGLGLSISYFIIVKEHKGKIRMEQGQDGGAKFIIDLP